MGLLSSLASLLGSLSPAHIYLVTALSGAKKVGKDAQGNVYYSAKPRKGYKYDRRWVMYKGAAEASKIPPEWHGWMHHQSNDVPDSNTTSYRRIWQKPHTQNLTGTTSAYRPPGHILMGGKRDKATGDYEAWTPEQ